MSGEPFAFTLIADSGTESNVTVVGNAVQLQYTGGGTGGCFYVGTSTTSTVTSVSIHGNNCYLTGSTGKAVGVWVQSNSSSASVTNTSITRTIGLGLTSPEMPDGGSKDTLERLQELTSGRI